MNSSQLIEKVKQLQGGLDRLCQETFPMKDSLAYPYLAQVKISVNTIIADYESAKSEKQSQGVNFDNSTADSVKNGQPDDCREAFLEWHEQSTGVSPPPALNCKTHEGMTFGNAISEARWLGFKGAWEILCKN